MLHGLNLDQDLDETLYRLRSLLDDLERAANGRVPSRIDVGIDQWLIAGRTAPCLIGQMSNHPSIGDGRVGATSELYFINQEQSIARTFNRWYRLGSCVTDVGGRDQ